MIATYATYAEFHVYERLLVLRDGRRVAYVGPLSAAVVADMQAAGVKIR
jgi:hypothetical protein